MTLEQQNSRRRATVGVGGGHRHGVGVVDFAGLGVGEPTVELNNWIIGLGSNMLGLLPSVPGRGPACHVGVKAVLARPAKGCAWLFHLASDPIYSGGGAAGPRRGESGVSMDPYKVWGWRGGRRRPISNRPIENSPKNTIPTSIPAIGARNQIQGCQRGLPSSPTRTAGRALIAVKASCRRPAQARTSGFWRNWTGRARGGGDPFDFDHEIFEEFFKSSAAGRRQSQAAEGGAPTMMYPTN